MEVGGRGGLARMRQLSSIAWPGVSVGSVCWQERCAYGWSRCWDPGYVGMDLKAAEASNPTNFPERRGGGSRTQIYLPGLVKRKHVMGRCTGVNTCAF